MFYSKRVPTLIAMLIAVLFAGCESMSPTSRAVFNIGLRSVAYEAGLKNPGSIQKMVGFASFLSSLDQYLSPVEFDERLDDEIAQSSLDDFQRANVEDLAMMVKGYYRKLHEKHGDLLTDSQAIEVVQNIGQALSFGLVPSVDGPAEFVVESKSLIVVVD